MSKQVEVIEVGPRDGFQSVKCTPITTEQKLTVIDQLVAAGVKHIEYTSFVSPKAIPQLADAADVTRVAGWGLVEHQHLQHCKRHRRVHLVCGDPAPLYTPAGAGS